ncbi:DNA starvation/stationary phase protection protein [Algoriphagus sp. AGSA1]|uniref:Dps family protein n=1 Tax=Algoriphagus sp. AGSA1 TaxID=2907213 RepID=UPI001F47AB57|nr:Dps family protein [Algoriphagus sp. AGSA1]MCE7054220.1 DNA starvation/stationary phase protection protein [Algoriphagus sp. AGSA1]
MKKLSQIGLDIEKSKELSILLNELLANYSIFYQNVRGYHWNIQGDKFFELHSKFEELYNNLFLKIDEIAERILTLGFNPNYKFSSYLSTTLIKESNLASNGKNSIQEILESIQILLSKQRILLEKSEELNDAGTNDLMNDYVSEQEKLVWMYSAYLKSN